MVIGCFTVVLWSGYCSCLSIASHLPGSIAVAILVYAIFNFVSRGCGFAYGQSKFAFDSNTSSDYKYLGEGNIFFITPPLPRIQGRIRIYIYRHIDGGGGGGGTGTSEFFLFGK